MSTFAMGRGAVFAGALTCAVAFGATGCSGSKSSSSSSGSTGITTAGSASTTTGTHGSSSSSSTTTTGSSSTSSTTGSSSGSTGTTASNSGSGSGSTTSNGSTTASNSGSGSGGSTGTNLNAGMTANDPATFTSPFDAVASPAAVLFSAISTADGTGQVFAASPPVSGNALEINAVTQGNVLVAPAALAFGSDLSFSTVYVADPAGNNGLVAGNANFDHGAIFTFTTSSGASTPTVVSGTEGFEPTGVGILADPLGGDDTLIFTGRDPVSGSWGLYSMDAAGGNGATVLSQQGDLVRPSNIALDSLGDVYIADNDGTTTSIKLFDGTAIGTIASGLKTGWPTGLSLNADGFTLDVAAIDPATGKSAIAHVDTTGVNPTTFTVVGTGNEPAGLHGDSTGTLSTFVDGTANGGTVFVVAP